MSEENFTIAETLLFKLPFLFIGFAIGMGVVWVALQWVPAVAAVALRGMGAE